MTVAGRLTAHPRRMVVDETRLLLEETRQRIDRLVAALDPSIDDAVPEFSYARGLLAAASSVVAGLARERETLTVRTDDLAVTEPAPPRVVAGIGPASPQRGWFG